MLLLGQQLDLQRRDDSAGELVLNCEDVRQVPVVTLGPDVAAAASVDQLGGDPDPLPHLANASFEDMGHTELAGDLAHVDGLPLELEGCVPGDDFERRHFRQICCDVLADAVAEIFLFGVAGSMFENGSTQMEVFWLLGFVACIGAIGLPVSSATLARSFCHPG